MSYADQLSVEINTRIDALVAAGEPVRATWIAHAICQSHSDGLAHNEEAEFWKHGGYKTCREEVRRCINRRMGDSETGGTDQMVFDGFEHLQRYYMVDRDGDQVGVPVEAMTDEEIDAKEALYRNMGIACFAHADELSRFKHWRTAPPLFQEVAEASEAANA